MVRRGLLKGKALEGIHCCINQKEMLKAFLKDWKVSFDNSATEGVFRNFCLYKHAWKLIDSIDGAKSRAIVYSITETIKLNHLKLFRYLSHVLKVFKDYQDDMDNHFIEELLS